MEYAIFCPHCHRTVATYKNPAPTVDIVVIRDDKVLMVMRRNPPIAWALPGGFIDYGEMAEEAAVRELFEETGLETIKLRLVGVYSDPARDPRRHTLTVAYLATARGTERAGDDAADLRWFHVRDLPQVVAFDHRKIIQDALEAGRLTGSPAG